MHKQLRNTPLAVLALAVVGGAQQVNDVPAGELTGLFSQPGSSWSALGDPVLAPLNLDALTGEDGCLGVEHAFGYIWVTGRGTSGTAPILFHAIYQINPSTGALVNIFPAAGPSVGSSAWGHRDLEADESNGKLWAGHEGGNLTEYDYNAFTNTLTFNQEYAFGGAVGTVRALARDTTSGLFYSKSFGSALFELDIATATAPRSLAQPLPSTYGLAYDWVNNTFWAADTSTSYIEFKLGDDGMGGMTFNPTGQSFIPSGLTVPTAIGGADIYYDCANPGSLTLLGLVQGTPDEFGSWDIATAVSSGSIGCIATVNSAGCTPAISSSGASLSATSGGYTVQACGIMGNVPTLLIYSLNSTQIPFMGGTLCVGPAGIRRTPTIRSGGTKKKCDGTASFDLGGYVQGGSDPALIPNAVIYCQYYQRDNGAPGGAGFTDSLKDVIVL